MFRSLSSIYTISQFHEYTSQFFHFHCGFLFKTWFLFLSNADYFRENLVTIIESIELHVTEHSSMIGLNKEFPVCVRDTKILGHIQLHCQAFFKKLHHILLSLRFLRVFDQLSLSCVYIVLTVLRFQSIFFFFFFSKRQWNKKCIEKNTLGWMH